MMREMQICNFLVGTPEAIFEFDICISFYSMMREMQICNCLPENCICHPLLSVRVTGFMTVGEYSRI